MLAVSVCPITLFPRHRPPRHADLSFVFQFHVIASYPCVWNMPQSWQCEIEVYKATYHFIYAQKNFFTGQQRRSTFLHDYWDPVLRVFSVHSDLIKDWASDSAPDIYSFVPYSWKFKILFHQFEMIWAANQHNWIDCSTKQQENGEQAALHELFRSSAALITITRTDISRKLKY